MSNAPPHHGSPSSAHRRPNAVYASPTDHELTLLVPSYEEEHRLPATLAGLAEFLDGWGIDYRVVVVDDGSRDQTARISDRFGRRFSTLRLDAHAGKGAAVRRGMLAATGQIVAFTDADLPYDLSALQTGCHWIHRGDCQVVFGARDLIGATCHVRRKLSRIVASAAFRQLVRLSISKEVCDTQCGLKIFGRSAAVEIFSRTRLDGFAFDAEVVLLCHRLQLQFRRVAVRLINEYSSTLSVSRHGWRMLRDVAMLAVRDRLSGRAVPSIHTPVVPDESRKAA
ncbi:MAG TPA: glycosyltransferase [Pirellulales bacterium]|jgi:glycosyltransferase involved in cell wall biosynthesis|nr:glycosyltransferase [Pirellulales bacterium]